MLIISIAAVIAILTVYVAYRLQRRIDPASATSPVTVFALVVLCVGMWLLLSILGCYFLQIPGSTGTVQYWTGDAAAMRVFNVRLVAAIVVLFGTPISLLGFLTSLVMFAFRSPSRVIPVAVIPVLGYLTFFLATWLFFACHFFPTV